MLQIIVLQRQLFRVKRKKSRCSLKGSKDFNLATCHITPNSRQNPSTEEVEVALEFAIKVVVEAMQQVKDSLTILKLEDVAREDEDKSVKLSMITWGEWSKDIAVLSHQKQKVIAKLEDEVSESVIIGLQNPQAIPLIKLSTIIQSSHLTETTSQLLCLTREIHLKSVRTVITRRDQFSVTRLKIGLTRSLMKVYLGKISRLPDK